MTAPLLINNIDQLKANGRTYMDLLNNPQSMNLGVRHTILKTTTTARKWFAFEEDGKWFVVPAKFAGYEDMNADTYEAFRENHMHGGLAERACLKAIGSAFKKTDVDGSEPAAKLVQALASKHRDKVASSGATVYILDTVPAAQGIGTNDQKRIDAAVSVIRSMQFNDAATARAAIAAAIA